MSNETFSGAKVSIGDVLPYVLLITGFCIIGFLAYTTFWNDGFAHGVGQSAATAIDQRLDESVSACSTSIDVATSLSCFKRSVSAGLDDWPKSQDLIAQTSMASSSRWSLYVSVLSLLVAALTIYWVRETLVASRGATKAAQDMVTLERPWILPAERSFVASPHMVQVDQTRAVLTYFMDLNWEVSGKIPARVTYMSSKMAEAAEGLPDFEKMAKKALTDIVVAPGRMISTGPFELTVAQIDHIIQRDARVFIWAKVRYSTHDGALRDSFTEVVYRVIPRRQSNPQQPIFFEWVPLVTNVS